MQAHSLRTTPNLASQSKLVPLCHHSPDIAVQKHDRYKINEQLLLPGATKTLTLAQLSEPQKPKLLVFPQTQLVHSTFRCNHGKQKKIQAEQAQSALPEK